MEVIDVNFVRLLIAFISGYFLSVSGSLSQLVTQNELASPSTLGLDAIVVLIILIGQLSIAQLGLNVSLEWFAFLIFILVFMIFSFTLIKKKTFNEKIDTIVSDVSFIILMGLGINLFIGAIFAVMQFLFMSLNYQFPTGLWFGSFRYESLEILGLYILSFFTILISLRSISSDLRLIAIGKEFATGLGVNVSKVENLSLIISLFCTGLVICFFGVFSYLGLLFPHILRMNKLFRKNMRYELSYGAILSGIFLASLDFICYNITFYGSELPVGMVSSVLGSFLLIILLIQKNYKKLNRK